MKKLITALSLALVAVAFIGCADKSKKADEPATEQPQEVEVSGSEAVEAEAETTPAGSEEVVEGEEEVDEQGE